MHARSAWLTASERLVRLGSALVLAAVPVRIAPAATAPTDRAPAASRLVVGVPGTMLAAAIGTVVPPALAGSGIRVVVEDWDGREAALQPRDAPAGASGALVPGLVLMPNATLLAACRDGAVADLDAMSTAAAPQAGSPPGAGSEAASSAAPPEQAGAGLQASPDRRDRSRCGRPGFLQTELIGWNMGRDQTPPGWADFWDVARYPGKRGLPRDARLTLEAALLADGVKPTDLTRTLTEPDGPARAFRKLDQLRPYVDWWSTGDQARAALSSGAVLMTMLPAGLADRSRGFGEQWRGALTELLSWAVPRRASPPLPPAPSSLPALRSDAAARTPPHPASQPAPPAPPPSASIPAAPIPPEAATQATDPAMRFLVLATDPQREAEVTALVPVLGASPGAVASLPPALLARTAAAPNRRGQILQVDDAFWDAHPALEARFRAWLAR